MKIAAVGACSLLSIGAIGMIGCSNTETDRTTSVANTSVAENIASGAAYMVVEAADTAVDSIINTDAREQVKTLSEEYDTEAENAANGGEAR